MKLKVDWSLKILILSYRPANELKAQFSSFYLKNICIRLSSIGAHYKFNLKIFKLRIKPNDQFGHVQMHMINYYNTNP
jgi:hypothetical protein